MKNNPHSGMPYGVIDLTAAEYASVQQWLQNGAPLTDSLGWRMRVSSNRLSSGKVFK